MASPLIHARSSDIQIETSPEGMKKVTVGGVIVYYHSGWRRVDSLLVNGWKVASPGALQMARINDTIHLTSPDITGLDGTTATDSTFLTLPSGWRPALPGNYGQVGELRGGGESHPITKNFNSIASAGRRVLGGLVSWPTKDPVPTVEFGISL